MRVGNFKIDHAVVLSDGVIKLALIGQRGREDRLGRRNDRGDRLSSYLICQRKCDILPTVTSALQRLKAQTRQRVLIRISTILFHIVYM